MFDLAFAGFFRFRSLSFSASEGRCRAPGPPTSIRGEPARMDSVRGPGADLELILKREEERGEGRRNVFASQGFLDTTQEVARVRVRESCLCFSMRSILASVKSKRARAGGHVALHAVSARVISVHDSVRDAFRIVESSC